MKLMNKVMLVGRVGKDPELRQPASGGPVWGTVSVATNRNKRDGDKWVEETDWHLIKVFGREAEYVQKHVRRGALVAIEGSVAYERWTTPDGSKHFGTRILAERVAMLAPPAVRPEGGEPASESEITAQAK